MFNLKSRTVRRKAISPHGWHVLRVSWTSKLNSFFSCSESTKHLKKMPKFYCHQNTFSSTYLTSTSHEMSPAWKSYSHVKSRLVFNLSLHSKTYYRLEPLGEIYKRLPRMPQRNVLFIFYFYLFFLISFSFLFQLTLLRSTTTRYQVFLRPTPGFNVDVQKLDTVKFGKRQRK